MDIKRRVARKIAGFVACSLALSMIWTREADHAVSKSSTDSRFPIRPREKGFMALPAAKPHVSVKVVDVSPSYGRAREWALFVFTMVRTDLLDLHLSSIDFPAKHVFVVLNYETDAVKNSTLGMLEKYTKCGTRGAETPKEVCSNPNIKNIHLIATGSNVGFAGSVNLGIKAMKEYHFTFTIFSGDDTRFLPDRLRAAVEIVQKNSDVCIFHFEGYSSFALTHEGARRIGPFDENFWPAYAEDCDYWLRAQLIGCKVYYRAGYSPEISTRSKLNAFVEHGDVDDSGVRNSVTLKSSSTVQRLVEGTLDSKRGRFAYLVRKWGVEACSYYHEVLHASRDEDEVIDPQSDHQLRTHGVKFKFPYNNSVRFKDLRRWEREDWMLSGTISPRAVNSEAAPSEFVWKEEDFDD